jgi:putative phosphoesterase
MRILLISDVHSNLPALDAVLGSASYEEVVFLGDAVDYGPFPFEVYSRLKQVRARRVLGNHDAAAAFGVDCRSSPQMHDASTVTRERITVPRMPRRAMQALGKAERRMNLDYQGLRIMAVHASPDDELYGSVSKETASTLDVQGADLLLLGHTHVPYEVKTENAWAVNPGSVGMPMDGDHSASFAVLDTHRREVRFGRAEYDVESMLTKLNRLIGEETRTYELLAGIFRTGRIG